MGAGPAQRGKSPQTHDCWEGDFLLPHSMPRPTPHALQPIVVMAPSPTLVAQAVEALVSLIRPLKYYSDYRPYFTIHNTEFKDLTTKKQAP